MRKKTLHTKPFEHFDQENELIWLHYILKNGIRKSWIISLGLVFPRLLNEESSRQFQLLTISCCKYRKKTDQRLTKFGDFNQASYHDQTMTQNGYSEFNSYGQTSRFYPNLFVESSFKVKKQHYEVRPRKNGK